MNHVISAAKKKEFLIWFMDNYQLKKQEATWLLSYLASDGDWLNRVHFVERFRNLPKILILSTTCVSMPALKYYKGNNIVGDMEEIFRDIRSHPNEDLYIGMFFKDRHACPYYLSVLESNPAERMAFATRQLQEIITDILLEEILLQERRRRLRQEIDQSLDARDKEEFYLLTSQLNQLQKQNES